MKFEDRLKDSTALAYIGDAFYELYIREYALKHGGSKINNVNRLAIKYVKADSQAIAAKKLIENFLTVDEVKIVKRGRNHTNTNHPRGTDPLSYKWATGFEALIGYLYISNNRERCHEILNETIKIINQSICK